MLALPAMYLLVDHLSAMCPLQCKCQDPYNDDFYFHNLVRRREERKRRALMLAQAAAFGPSGAVAAGGKGVYLMLPQGSRTHCICCTLRGSLKCINALSRWQSVPMQKAAVQHWRITSIGVHSGHITDVLQGVPAGPSRLSCWEHEMLIVSARSIGSGCSPAFAAAIAAEQAPLRILMYDNRPLMLAIARLKGRRRHPLTHQLHTSSGLN